MIRIPKVRPGEAPPQINAYCVLAAELQLIDLPRGAQILNVQMRETSENGSDVILIYALIRPDAPLEKRVVNSFLSGLSIGSFAAGQVYLGMATNQRACLDYHVFIQ